MSIVSWFYVFRGFIGFVVSIVSWFHRFRGFYGFMVLILPSVTCFMCFVVS